jgi:NitT/TauT family transport system permease protein/sulfonate transport system permease protein
MKGLLKRLLTVGAVLAIVQSLYAAHVRFPYQPAPVEVLKTFFFVLLNGEILPDLWASVCRVLVGFLLAAFCGIGLGVLLAWKRQAGDYVAPLLEVIRPIPPIAWIPIAILVFGIGNSAAYFIVFLGAFFPIFTNTYFGCRSVPRALLNACVSYQINGWHYAHKVLFYYALPYSFTGMAVGAGTAWMSVIAAELAGVQGGIGYFIQYNRLLLNIDYVIAGMLYVGILGAGFVALIRITEKFVVPWHQKP